MKEIMTQYGKAMLSGIAFLLIVGLLFLENSPVAIRKQMKDGAEKVSGQNMDITKTKHDVKRRKPQISSMENLRIDNTYKASELIQGDGITRVKLISVMDDKENDISEVRKGEEVCFKEPGVYRISLYVEDSKGGFGTEDLYIGVGE